MWRFDPSLHLLVGEGGARHLEPKAVAVLARLAAEPGAVVSRQALLAAGWPGQYVGEEVLAQTIYRLRQALGDDAKSPRYIQTIPKRGYRLLRPLAVPEASPTPGPRHPGRRRWLAAAIAASLAAPLLLLVAGPGRVRETPPPAAHASALVDRGWGLLEAGRPGARREATLLAEAALALAPDDPDPWALLATATPDPSTAREPADAEPSYAGARAAAERALRLEPGHPRALVARARARWLGEWDWSGAEADLVAALAEAPDTVGAWTTFAELLVFSGRLAEASAAADQALRRAPGSVDAGMTAALVASLAGDAPRAAALYRAILARHPDHPAARRQLAKLERPTTPPPLDRRVADLAAKERLRPAHLALWFAESGDDASALDWLERAVTARDPTILFFPFDPRWDRLREHPRYRAAMRTAGLGARS